MSLNHNTNHMVEGLRGEFRDMAPPVGRNTEVRFTFVRHSQKSSGNVFGEAGTISASGISENGKKRAGEYGANVLTGRDVDKAYATKVQRTSETLEQAFRGAGIDPHVLEEGGAATSFFALPGQSSSKAYNDHFNSIMDPEKFAYVERMAPGKKFADLSTDQQEMAAEYAEEPAMEWYLSLGDKRFDADTPSPRETAAQVAYKMNRLVNLPDLMKSGAVVDLVSAGHKTSTEAFLKYVIEREVDGNKVIGFDHLSDIGGSIKILDSWDLDVKNDEQGKKQATITLRRENGQTTVYSLNQDALRTLANEFIQAQGLDKKKIDQ